MVIRKPSVLEMIHAEIEGYERYLLDVSRNTAHGIRSREASDKAGNCHPQGKDPPMDRKPVERFGGDGHRGAYSGEHSFAGENKSVHGNVESAKGSDMTRPLTASFYLWLFAFSLLGFTLVHKGIG